MHKRITVLFCTMVLLMTGMIYRIYYINASDSITQAAQVQGKYQMTVAETRGVIYDRSLKSLVNNQYKYLASVLPTPQAAATLVDSVPESERPALMQRLSDARPFVLPVQDSNIYAPGVDLFRVAERYGGTQYAPHLLGYLNDGAGAAGIERAYEEALASAGGDIRVVYQTDAMGRFMERAAVGVRRTNEEPVGGVVLTLDRDIQQLTQNALARGAEKGAAVVMDIASGDILAMASLPVFDQNDISSSLQSEDAPFVNRAISGWNIGSVFKLLIAAGALENGIGEYYSYECTGSINVDGQIFRCNNNAVHGVSDMERALEVSCNCYFINLAQQLPPETFLSLLQNMGLNTSVELASGIYGQQGNLPTSGELELPAAYANFSFGQGSSLASPLQMAQAVAALAGGGMSVTPRLVRGTTADGIHIDNERPPYAGGRVVSEKTAATMRHLMEAVVEEGSGKPAKPIAGGAGGKTSSAQTGRYITTEDGEQKEIVHAWFTGFAPVDQPKYAVAVFVEGGESGERVAGPIFKAIIDGIASAKQDARKEK